MILDIGIYFSHCIRLPFYSTQPPKINAIIGNCPYRLWKMESEQIERRIEHHYEIERKIYSVIVANCLMEINKIIGRKIRYENLGIIAFICVFWSIM